MHGERMGRVAVQEPAERIKELRREREATEGAAAGAVLDFEIGWLCEKLGQVREAAESYLRGLSTLSTFRPNLSALIRLAEQTGANPKGLYEAALKNARSAPLRRSAQVDLATLALAQDNLDQALLRALVVEAQEEAMAETPDADLALALELCALRLGEESLARQGRDLQIASADLAVLRPFLIEERLWDVLRDQTSDSTRFAQTDADVRHALAGLNKSNQGRRIPILELAAQIARQAGHHTQEARWLDELSAFVLRIDGGDEDSLDVYALIASQGPEGANQLAAAIAFEAGDAKRRAGAHDQALGSLREAFANAHSSSELDRMIIAESLMLAAERAGELKEAGGVARDLLSLEVPPARQQILWLRLAALEQARGEIEAAIIATGHALETHSDSIAARAALIRLLTDSERDHDLSESLENWARHQDGESRAVLLWHAAHVAARSSDSRTNRAVASLFDAAIASAEHPAEILRAYADWSANGHDQVEALLRVSQDPMERTVLKRQRWVEDKIRLKSDAGTVLTELLDDPDCRAWAPAVVRYHAASEQRFELLAQAHVVSAQGSDDETPTDVQAAHLLAAARAYIRAGKTSKAEPLLQQVLGLDERNAYGIALLSEVLQRAGDEAQHVALLARVASKEDERSAAQRKTHAAASEAERHGLFESAARAYQTFLQRHPDTPTVAWCLLRLSDRTDNLVWREQALEHLASYERQQGHPGYATLRWIEHLALLSRRTTAQHGALLSALAFAQTQPATATLTSVWQDIVSPARSDTSDPSSLQTDLHALAQLESDWRQCELKAGALRFMLLDTHLHDEAFLEAQVQYESSPSAQTALSSLETVPWTTPANLGMRWEEAVEHWQSGLTTLSQQAPDFVDPALMARWHLHNNQLEPAFALAERAVSDDPDDLASWMVLRNAAHALEQWDVFVQANEIVAEPLSRGRRAELKTLSGFACAFGLGDSARASTYVLEALELDPLNNEAFGWAQQHLRGRQRNRMVGSLMARIENTDDAQELLDLHLDLAMAHQAGGEFREAAVVLEHALLLDETNEHLLAGVAETWIHLEEWERAQAALLSLAKVAAQTDTFDACVLSAADILQNRLRRTDRAIAVLVDAYPAMAAKLAALDMLCHALELQQEFRKAAGYAQEAIALTTHDERHPWLLRLGQLQRRAGDLHAAREAYREALDRTAGDTIAFKELHDCGMPPEERRIRGRQLIASLRESLSAHPQPNLLRVAHALADAATWTDNVVLGRHAKQVIETLSQTNESLPSRSPHTLPDKARRTSGQPPFASTVQRFRLRAENPLDRAAERLQDVLLGILEHSLEAYGVVHPLDAGDPVARALSEASTAFGFDQTPVYRSTRGDDAIGFVLGADRKPAWVVGANFQIEGRALSRSKRFIVAQLASAYALGVLPFVAREHSNAVAIWKSLRTAMGQQRLDPAHHRFEETLRARVPKALQAELEPRLRQTTNVEFRRWCENAYAFVLRAGAAFCGELVTPLRAIDRERAGAATRETMLSYWLSADAETATRYFWSEP